MKKIALSSIFFGLIGAAPLSHLKDSLRENFGLDKVIKFESDNIGEEVLNVLHSSGADHFGNGNFKVSSETFHELKSLGAQLNEVTEEWIEHFENNFDNENYMCVDESCASRSLDTFYASYQNLASLHARAKANVEGVSFAKVISIGKSYEGRDQLGVEFGDGKKPLAFFWCNIHAREWLTPMFCSYFIEILAKGHAILNTFDITVIVSANPDGYVFSTTSNNMWRKTRRPNTDVGSTCVGTDPNRNYDYYHCGAGTSNSACSDVYCGPKPFSEVEVLNIVNYARKNQARLILTHDIHAYGKMWMFPYGSISSKAPEPDYSKQLSCSEAAVKRIQAVSGGSLWAYGPIYSTIYPAAGSSVDYMYAELDVIYSYTAEVRGTSFQPATNQIEPSNIELFEAMIASLTCIAKAEALPLTVTTPDDVKVSSPEDTPPCKYFFC